MLLDCLLQAVHAMLMILGRLPKSNVLLKVPNSFMAEKKKTMFAVQCTLPALGPPAFPNPASSPW